MSPAGQLPKLPRRIDPEAFYLDYVPALWQAYVSGLEQPWPAWTFELEFDIESEDGQHAYFALRFAAGVVAGYARRARSPMLSVAMQRTAWELGVHGATRDFLRFVSKDLAASRSNVSRFLAAGAKSLRLEEITAQPGRIDVQYTDDAGDTGQCAIHIGSGKGPSVQLQINDADLWNLMNAQGRPLRLLKALRVEGDASYFLRVASIAFSD